MKEWEGTKGKWFKSNQIEEQNEHGVFQLSAEVNIDQGGEENAYNFVIVYDIDPVKAKANFNLIIDAANTMQECGMMPSELKIEK